MVKIITEILNLIANFLKFKIKTKEQEIKQQEKDKKHKKSIDEQKEDAEKAVFNGDVDTINKIINSGIIVICSMLLLTGCITKEKLVYVESDREVKKMTYENVDGYFVPSIVLKELLHAKIEAKYYKEQYESIKHQKDM